MDKTANRMAWLSGKLNRVLGRFDIRLGRASSFENLLSELAGREARLGEALAKLKEPQNHERLLGLSKQRWRGDEPADGLTWGVPMVGDEFVRFLTSHVTLTASSTIVEIGPGYGRILDALLKQAVPFGRYIGLEISPARVARLWKQFQDPRIEFREADVLGDFKLNAMADLTFSSAVFEHLYPDFGNALDAIAQFTKPGGSTLIDFIRDDERLDQSGSWFDHETYIRVYSIQELKELFEKNGFLIREFGRISFGRDALRREITRTIVFATKGDTGRFDEAWYLREYPDIAKSVAEGRIESGYAHWIKHGRNEGRNAPPEYEEGSSFDRDWYLNSYPAVRTDIEAGRAPDPEDHYRKLGRHRGYLPNRFAPRPDNPAGFASRFGGLWPDQANAQDLIEGRRELGRITEEQAILLRHWTEKGFVILPQALPAEIVEPAFGVLKRAYGGQMEEVRFECPTVGGYNPVFWDKAVQTHPAKALDLHWLSEEIRNLVFAAPIREFLELIFERRVLATQSLTFLRGSAQGYHQDTLYVPFTLCTQFAASWIALEDVQPGGGELTYYVGSHRLPEMLFSGRFKTLRDAERMLRRNTLREEMADYSERLAINSESAGLSKDKLMARKGDVLLWHSDLIHGGMPISGSLTRGSIVTHYCPKEVASLAFEHGRTSVRSHEGKAWYSTGYYK